MTVTAQQQSQAGQEIRAVRRSGCKHFDIRDDLNHCLWRQNLKVNSPEMLVIIPHSTGKLCVHVWFV